MSTANTLIADALGLLGIIGSAESVGGNDAVTSLRVLNRLLDSWRQQPHMALSTAWLSFSLPAGATTRTIGPSGQVAAERPTQLEIGCYTSIGGVDQPLELIGQDQYAALAIKTMAGSWPNAVYYDAASPAATAYFWPAPGSDCTVYLAVRTQLVKFADLTTDYTLADGYEAAIVPSLAEKLAPYFERQVPAIVARDAAVARRALRRTNASVPELTVGDSAQPRLGDFIGG